MDRILEVEPEPSPDAWASTEAIRPTTCVSALSALVDQFLAKGGVIQEVGFGVNTTDFSYPTTGTCKTLADARKRGTRISIAARRSAK